MESSTVTTYSPPLGQTPGIRPALFHGVVSLDEHLPHHLCLPFVSAARDDAFNQIELVRVAQTGGAGGAVGGFHHAETDRHRDCDQDGEDCEGNQQFHQCKSVPTLHSDHPFGPFCIWATGRQPYYTIHEAGIVQKSRKSPKEAT